MADVKWIKIVTDIFDDEKMLLIDAMPSADSIITIWFKLLCLAGKTNNNGVFLLSEKLAYTDEMLSAVFKRELPIVRQALEKFEQLGMVEIIDNTITIPNWNKYQTLDSYERKKERDRLYQEKRRAKQKQLIEQKSSDNRLTTDDTSSFVAVSEEEKEIDIDIYKDKRERIDYQQIADMYNNTCVSFPRCKSLSDARKKSIKARLNTYSLTDLQLAFEKVEKSDFLKGKNDRNWSANFDWILKDSNMAKILDGNYDGKKGDRTNEQVGRVSEQPGGIEDLTPEQRKAFGIE